MSKHQTWSFATVDVRGMAYLPTSIRSATGVQAGSSVCMRPLGEGAFLVLSATKGTDNGTLDELAHRYLREEAPRTPSDLVEQRIGVFPAMAMPATPELFQEETRGCFGVAVQVQREKDGGLVVRIPSVASRWSSITNGGWVEVVAYRTKQAPVDGTVPAPQTVALALLPVAEITSEIAARLNREREMAELRARVEQAKLEAATAKAEAAERIKAIKGSYNHYDQELSMAKNGEEFFKKEAERLAKEKAELEAALKGWNQPGRGAPVPSSPLATTIGTPPAALETAMAVPGSLTQVDHPWVKLIPKIEVDDEPFATRKEHILAWRAGTFPTPPRNYVEGEEMIPDPD